MKQLTCEMCGGTDLMKQDGVFVCQSCGCKYSVEEAKKMMIEGTVDVQGTVKVDMSEKVRNLYVMARRAKDDNNAELASKYYEMITFENPDDWEALFYFNYCEANKTNLINMSSSVVRLANSLGSVFDLIDKSDKSADEKWSIAKEIIACIDVLCDYFVYEAKAHYRKFPQVAGSISGLKGRTSAIANLQKNMADLLEKYFAENSEQVVVNYLKLYVKNYLLLDTIDKVFVNTTLEFHANELIKTEEKIKKLDPNYVPLINKQDACTSNQSSTELTGSAFYGPLIGSIVWAAIPGLALFMFVTKDLSFLLEHPFLTVFLLIFFICPCVLLVWLIADKIKSKTRNNMTKQNGSDIDNDT